MEVKIKVKLKSFTVPNYVITEGGAHKVGGDEFVDPLKYRLSELDSETLEKLCEEFTRAVFKKASKPRLPQIG